MFRSLRAIWGLACSACAGVVAVIGLLGLFRMSSWAEAAPVQMNLSGQSVVLWLQEPAPMNWQGDWVGAIEIRRVGWQTKSDQAQEKLAALQSQGQIDGFAVWSPVCLIITAPLGLPTLVERWPETARITSLDAATPEAMAAWWWHGSDMPAQARRAQAVAASTLTLSWGLHNSMISGRTTQPDPVYLSLIVNGSVYRSDTAYPIPDGLGHYLFVGEVSQYCGGKEYGYVYTCPVQPGSVLRAVQAGQTISVTAPPLTVLADQHTATVYGHTLPSTTLDIFLYRHSAPGISFQQAITSVADGDFALDWSGLTDMSPRDFGFAFLTDARGNRVYTRYNVPFFLVGVGAEYMEAWLVPNSLFTITLYNAEHIRSGTRYGRADSQGQAVMEYGIPPQAGYDLIVAAGGQVFSLTVPALTAYFDEAQQGIFGQALPGQPIQIELYHRRGDGYNRHRLSISPDVCLTTTASPGGDYAFTGPVGLTGQSYGLVSLTNADGYQFYRYVAEPFLRVQLDGDSEVEGQINASGPATLTVWSDSHIPRSMADVRPGPYGWFRRSLGWQLAANDWITVTTQGQPEAGLHIPPLTVQTDIEHGLIYGQTRPHARLRIELWSSGQAVSAQGGPLPTPTPPPFTGGSTARLYTLWVTATAEGVYTASVAGLTALAAGDYGVVFYVSPAGHEAWKRFNTPSLNIHSGGNEVQGTWYNWPCPVEGSLCRGVPLTVTLYGGGGQVKTQAVYADLYSGGWFNVEFREGSRPVTILAGDTVEVADGRQTLRVSVPPLSIRADRAADRLTGQSPPNTPLQIVWQDPDTLYSYNYLSKSWFVTSTAAGDWSLNLSGLADLERGDSLILQCRTAGHLVWTSALLPRLDVSLTSNWVTAWNTPSAPVSLQWFSITDTLLYSETGSSRANYVWFDLSKWGSSPFYLSEGQRVTARVSGETMSLTLPHLTARVDADADMVLGEAPPGARLLVYSDSQSEYLSRPLMVTATPSGTFAADFSGIVDLYRWTRGRVIYVSADDHRVEFHYTHPTFQVTLNNSWIRVSMAGYAVRITLLDALGQVKGSIQAIVYNGLYAQFRDAQGMPVNVLGGDTIQADWEGGSASFVVTPLVADFDGRTGLMQGAAPPHAWLLVYVGLQMRLIRADAEGRFVMDWGDVARTMTTPTVIVYQDEAGHTVRLSLTPQWYQMYLPAVINLSP